jgi:hypothetical protein
VKATGETTRQREGTMRKARQEVGGASGEARAR